MSAVASNGNLAKDEGGFLTRDAILSADDSKFEIVEVPEWGEGAKVRVRALNGTDRDAFEAAMIQQKGRDLVLKAENTRARFVAMSVVDHQGNRIFSNADVLALGKKSAAALDRVYQVAQKLSRFSEEDVQELVGNSDGVLSDD